MRAIIDSWEREIHWERDRKQRRGGGKIGRKRGWEIEKEREREGERERERYIRLPGKVVYQGRPIWQSTASPDHSYNNKINQSIN